jgi:hypothetical protein
MVLFLTERRAPLSPERAAQSGQRASEAEALIKEARRRRRLRWIRGTAAVLLAAVGVTSWVLLKRPPGASDAAGSNAARLAASSPCASSVVYGPLPVWARSGFTPPNVAMPHVLGAGGSIVAVLWVRHNALAAPALPNRNNKILWVSKLSAWDGPLQITARLLAGGTGAEPLQRRTVAGGPGPSIIDMPTAGCWQFTLRWSGHADTIDLPYAAVSTPS